MLDAVSLDHLRIFIAAADEGSFSAGGRRLRRTQSVISQTLANLEALKSDIAPRARPAKPAKRRPMSVRAAR